MRKFVVVAFSFLLIAYLLAPSSWFHSAKPLARAEARAEATEQPDPFDTDAAWYYRRGQIKHWRMLVIQH